MKCPKCNDEMEHQDYDPSVGILTGGYFCQACDMWIDDADTNDEPDL